MNSEFKDIAAPILDDMIQERKVKIYPYELVNTDSSQSFIQQQSFSIASISQIPINANTEHLKIDDDGNKYFEILPSITSSAKLDVSTQTSVYGQELKEEDSITCLSNWFYEGKLAMIQQGKERILPVVCSIGKPFNKDDYESGIQSMYLVTNIIEGMGQDENYEINNINNEKLYQFDLINITVVEAQFNNTRIYFSKNLGDHLVNNNYKWLPKTTVNGVEKSGMLIELQTNSLVSRIDGKGIVENINSDIDLKVVEELTPIKATPVSIQDKLTLFMDWFDYDVVMPEFIAKQFINGSSINNLKRIDIDNDGKKEPFFTENEVNLICDMIAYSYAFASSFANFPRYTKAEAQDAGGGAKEGDIKGDQTIGSAKAKLIALESKDPIKVIDGLFELYIREHPLDDNSIQFRALKQIIAALSRYIYSSYSIGKGQNSFNQIYLPWYLVPSSNILIKESDNNWTFSGDDKFKLNSRWFDIKNGDIFIKTDVNISDVRLMQTDRKLTLPELPDTINAINKLPLPGDINTTTANDLMYYWYLPLSQTDFKKLFLDDISSPSNDNRKTFTTRWTNLGVRITDRNDFIKSEAAINYSVNKLSVSVVDDGTLETQSGTVSNLQDSSRKNEGRTYIYTGDSKWIGSVVRAVPELNRVKRELTEAEMKKALYYYSGVEEDMIEVISRSRIDYTQTSKESVFGGSYALKQERVKDTTVEISGRSIDVTLDRDTLFDKVGWHFFISDFLNISSNWYPYHLIEERDLDIENITEISVSQVWGNSIRIHIGVDTIEIPLFNADDETIGVERILFT